MKKKIILIVGTISALILLMLGYNKNRQVDNNISLYGVENVIEPQADNYNSH